MTAAIDISHLYKRYGNVTAVSDLSLKVPPGAFFGFLGANGAGKTTVIHILTGLCSRSSGQVLIFGKDVEPSYLECRRRIGLTPQEFNFDRFFSVRRILEFQGGYFGLPKRHVRQRVDDLLHQFGLWHKRKEKAQSLSGGFKRRLSLIKALIHDPDILILDEPTAGIDLELRLELWDYLQALNEQGKTILLTTHYLEEAAQLCKEIAIIHQGRIVEQGLTQELTSSHNKSLEQIFLTFVKGQGKNGDGK